MTTRSIRMWLQSSLLAFFLCFGCPSLLYAEIKTPGIASEGKNIIQHLAEEKLGRKIHLLARQRFEFIEDIELLHYLQGILQRLKYANGYEHQLQISLIDDAQINAFASPGGYLTIYTGMVDSTENESELASIIAHEIAHVSQYHLRRLNAQSASHSLPLTGALIAGLLLGGSEGFLTALTAQAVSIDKRLTFSRNFEIEADLVSLTTLEKTDFDPRALITFFDRIDRTEFAGGNAIPIYLSTHPLSLTRKTEVESRTPEAKNVAYASSPEFRFFRAKVQAIYSPQRDQNYFRQNINKLRDYDEYQYGLALRQMRDNEFSRARKSIAAVRNTPDSHLPLSIARAQIEFADNKPAKAIAILRKALHKSESVILETYLAETLLANGAYQEARSLLRKLLNQGVDYLPLYLMIARADGESGNFAESFIARARYAELLGAYEQAITQLQQGRKHVEEGDFNDRRITAKLTELLALRHAEDG